MKTVRYEAHSDIDLRYVGGEGYAFPSVARIAQIDGRNAVGYVVDYRYKWMARLVALVLNALARWEVPEDYNYKLKPTKPTAADMEWAIKRGAEFDSEIDR